MANYSAKRDEYDFDSSDEEDIRNTVGNVPMEWYESFPHVGYDATGRPIMRPITEHQSSDAISEFLKNASKEEGEQNSEWRTITDPMTGQQVVLSDRDLEIITRMSAGKGVLGDKEDDIFQPFEDIFSKDVSDMPVTAHPPQKRSFIPSLLDRRRVGRITHAIKMGWIKPRLPPWALDDPDDPEQVRRFAMYSTSGKPGAFNDDFEGEILGFSSSSVSYVVMPDVWADQDEKESQDQQSIAWQASLPASLRTYRPPRPSPYMRPAAEPLPGHAESYNPPPEFLLTEEEERKILRSWREKVKDNQAVNVLPFLPRRYDCLRRVPFSERYLRERGERVKDMVMAARVEKQKVHTTPEVLLPQIPSLADLRPFPNHSGLEYKSHDGRVTGLSISPCGQWLASVSPFDGCLRIWEVASNYCFRCYHLVPPKSGVVTAAGGLLKMKSKKAESMDIDDDDKEIQPVAHVSWNPNPQLCMVAAAFGNKIFLINPALGDRVIAEKTDKAIKDYWKSHLNDVEGAKAVELDEEEEEEIEDQKPPKKERKLTDALRDQVAVWSFKATTRINAITKSAAADANAFRVHFGKQVADAAPNRNEFSSRCKTLELSRVSIELHQECIDLSWHPKGDYLLSLSVSPFSSEARSRAANRVLLHRISQMSSQAPFAAATGVVSGSVAEEWRGAAFHPGGKPILYVASTRLIHRFDLVEQKELPRLKLDISDDYIVSLAVHPTGDHVITGTSDSRFVWFDVDMGNVPFKKLSLNHGTVHKVDVHLRRPLASVALDDGSLCVIHGKVSDDLLSKPQIIPVQMIRTGFHNTFSCVFHNRLPHIYAGGECGKIRQFVPWH